MQDFRNIHSSYDNYILSFFSQFKLQVWGIPILKQNHVVGVSLHWLHRTTPTSPGLKSINPLCSALNPNVSDVSCLSLHCFFMKCHTIPALVASICFNDLSSPLKILWLITIHPSFGCPFSHWCPSPRSIESRRRRALVEWCSVPCWTWRSQLVKIKPWILDIRSAV